MHCILHYLLFLKQQSLAISSIKIHPVAISAFHPPIDNFSIFSSSISIGFLKSLEGLYPQKENPIPLWDLNLMLSKL